MLSEVIIDTIHLILLLGSSVHGLPDSVSDQMKMNRDTKGLQVKLVNILNLCCTVAGYITNTLNIVSQVTREQTKSKACRSRGNFS